jgi:hypothetical protein
MSKLMGNHHSEVNLIGGIFRESYLHPVALNMGAATRIGASPLSGINDNNTQSRGSPLAQVRPLFGQLSRDECPEMV